MATGTTMKQLQNEGAHRALAQGLQRCHLRTSSGHKEGADQHTDQSAAGRSNKGKAGN